VLFRSRAHGPLNWRATLASTRLAAHLHRTSQQALTKCNWSPTLYQTAAHLQGQHLGQHLVLGRSRQQLLVVLQRRPPLVGAGRLRLACIAHGWEEIAGAWWSSTQQYNDCLSLLCSPTAQHSNTRQLSSMHAPGSRVYLLPPWPPRLVPPGAAPQPPAPAAQPGCAPPAAAGTLTES